MDREKKFTRTCWKREQLFYTAELGHCSVQPVVSTSFIIFCILAPCYLFLFFFLSHIHGMWPKVKGMLRSHIICCSRSILVQLVALSALGLLTFVMSNVTIRIHYWNTPDEVQSQEKLPTQSQTTHIQSLPSHFSQDVDTRMIDSFQVVCVLFITSKEIWMAPTWKNTCDILCLM